MVLAVLFVMTATSLDWAVKKMGFKNWKLLHRLVYLASLTLLLHISLIGSHFANGVTPQGILLGIAIIFLLWLEALRVWRTIHSKRSRQ